MEGKGGRDGPHFGWIGPRRLEPGSGKELKQLFPESLLFPNPHLGLLRPDIRSDPIHRLPPDHPYRDHLVPPKGRSTPPVPLIVDMHPGRSSAGSEGLPAGRGYACGVRGVLRALHCATTGAAWLCVANTRYRGAAHCAVLIAVLAWLLTLIVYVFSVLGKYDRLPFISGGDCRLWSRGGGGGGDDTEGVTRRWVTANVLLDAVLAPLLMLATGLAAREAHAASWCVVPEYGSSCPFALFVAAAVLTALGAVLSVASALLHWRLRSST